MRVDFGGQRMNFFDDPFGFQIGFIVVTSKVTADLILAFRGDQQNRTLHCGKTRQDQVQQNERVFIESDISIPDHPTGQEHQGCEHEPPRTHAISHPICGPFAQRQFVACSDRWMSPV